MTFFQEYLSRIDLRILFQDNCFFLLQEFKGSGVTETSFVLKLLLTIIIQNGWLQ